MFQLLQFVEEFAIAAVEFVGRDPIQPHHAQVGGIADQSRGDPGLGLEADRLADDPTAPCRRE
jgi:hypothetical protein